MDLGSLKRALIVLTFIRNRSTYVVNMGWEIKILSLQMYDNFKT